MAGIKKTLPADIPRKQRFYSFPLKLIQCLHQLILGLKPYEPCRLFSILEHDQGRNTHHAVLLRDGRILIHIQLAYCITFL